MRNKEKKKLEEEAKAAEEAEAKAAEEAEANAAEQADDETATELSPPAEESTEDALEAAKTASVLKSINDDLQHKLKNADNSGPFQFLRKAIHSLQGNAFFREFNKFVGEDVMEAIRFLAKNKDFFVDVIGLNALDIREQNGGDFGLEDITMLIEESALSALRIIDASPEKIDINVEWIEMAIRIITFILKSKGQLKLD